LKSYLFCISHLRLELEQLQMLILLLFKERGLQLLVYAHLIQVSVKIKLF
jgi:hypothetical protein